MSEQGVDKKAEMLERTWKVGGLLREKDDGWKF